MERIFILVVCIIVLYFLLKSSKENFGDREMKDAKRYENLIWGNK
jgi:hypothetical protein